MNLFNGTCNNCIYGDGKPLTCNKCGGILRGGFCFPCNLEAENTYNCYQDAYSFDYTSKNSNYLPQPQYENYLCNLCGNNLHDGYVCQQQFPFVYEQEPSYNQNYDEVSKEQKQSMEDTMLELVKICQEKEFLFIHDNVDDLIESALSSKLLLINSNSQRLDKKKQEVKNVVEQSAERGNRSIQSLQNFKVTLENKRECDVPISENSTICDDHSDIFSDSKIDDDISVYDDNFEDIEYVEVLLPDHEIVSIREENGVEEENVVQHDVEKEEIDLEDISQIQDVVLREKLLGIIRLISNIESLNDNPTPDCVLNSFEFDNSLLDTFSPEFETFCDHTEETRSGNTTHDDNSLLEYDSFCFEIEPGQERLINVVKSDIPNDSSNDPLLEEADLFLASDNYIPPVIENVVMTRKETSDNPPIPRPPPKPPDAETDPGEEIPVVMNDKDKFDEDYYFFMIVRCFLYSPQRVRIRSLTL
nr:hypothetical protein [Tanacetum cinerariifolium]